MISLADYLNILFFIPSALAILGWVQTCKKNIEELEDMLTELITEGGKAGLNINFQKTKILGRREKKNIRVGEETIEEVDEIVYLGQLLSFQKRREKEVKERIKEGWINLEIRADI